MEMDSYYVVLLFPLFLPNTRICARQAVTLTKKSCINYASSWWLLILFEEEEASQSEKGKDFYRKCLKGFQSRNRKVAFEIKNLASEKQIRLRCESSTKLSVKEPD